ncbi:unnamed protein product [Clonostachys rosea]|uniref:Transcription factor domain-containing protein n=1 Tax=Bionectria ochroleuca TaxID=29856 RepID=A0ABY6TUH5_BIOOC|nr:unnamed protein product [Clonostachys rosea]
MLPSQARKLTPHSASPGPALSSAVTSPLLRPDGTPDIFRNGFPPQGMLPMSNAGAIPINSHLPPTEDIITAPNNSAFALIRSPFQDCLNTFGTFKTQNIARPPEGFVNGYIKFAWSKDPQPGVITAEVLPNGETVPMDLSPPIRSSPTPPMPTIPPYAALRALINDGTLKLETSPSPTNISDLSPGGMDMSGFSTPSLDSQVSSPISSNNSVIQCATGPQMLPPQFGFRAKVENPMDRRFWQFYIKNWCPGRSVLKKTNLWLNDFASMHETEGVRAAMQSLAGVYIYDYVPSYKISRRVNELFSIAEHRMTVLLNDPEAAGDESKAQELITITTLLSMQDIVLTERRALKPYHPRWLLGFLEAENALQRIDPGTRFWNPDNIQLDSLRIAQSIMVGRAVILAQPMTPLISPQELDPQREASRFGWLLYGTEKEMYEIHGGCGFSKKLLHVVSQITYCAARLQQEPESPITPMTIRFLLDELQNMRQWSSESRSWDMAKEGDQTIVWVQQQPDGYTINTSADMTDVTAEAWRIAVIVYLQCRGLRLPRNHPEVTANLDSLARCIRIMPTSGSNFTAQAPLFPVFLLGLLATVPMHKEVSRKWFSSVVETPVRSSVPPLFDVLRRIWEWIDSDLPLDHKSTPESVSARNHWWERLVSLVHDKEPETLCLT